MRMRLSLVPALLVMLLAGCQMTAGSTGIDAVRVVCQGFAPITYSSSQDSPATIREIRAHNFAWVELCEN